MYIFVYVQDEVFNPLTDNNQIWGSNYSEPDEKYKLQKNFYFQYFLIYIYEFVSLNKNKTSVIASYRIPSNAGYFS
jgi:hypothetical protein